MIDILVYLFETYGYAEACPNEPDQLARKLAAAGFDEADIAEALDWLAGLRGTVQSTLPPATTDKRSLRVFSEHESARLDVASRSFLLFLCNTGVVNPHQRERMGIRPGCVRLSVGIEDPRDLLTDLAQAIECAFGA